MVQQVVPLVWARRRLLIAVTVGLVTAVIAAVMFQRLSIASRGLIAWNAGSAAYLIGTWVMFFRLDGQAIKWLAAEESEDQRLIFLVVISAVAVSLVAIFVVLAHASGYSQLEQSLAVPLALITLFVSWLLLHTLFTLHYARLYFGDYDRNGVIDGGVQFPYRGERSYLDFVYLAFNIAIAFQMSDIKTDNEKFRNTITVHSLISYLYNTVILALGINLTSSVIR